MVLVNEEIRSEVLRLALLYYIWWQVTLIDRSMTMWHEYSLERFATGPCVGYAEARIKMDASTLKIRESFM
jgi:hypothetical protein